MAPRHNSSPNVPLSEGRAQYPFDREAVEKFLEWLHFEKNIHLCYHKGKGNYEWSEFTIPRILKEYYEG